MGFISSVTWETAEPLMKGLKVGGLMNQYWSKGKAFKQGRHHVMTTVGLILQGTLLSEHISKCLEITKRLDIPKFKYSFQAFNIAQVVVPITTSFLASREIHVLNISQYANYVQDHLGNISFIATTIASIILLGLGQRMLALTTLAYLSIGFLDQYNILPESAQKIMRPVNFVISNVAGIYLGGNFIRVACSLNLIISAVEHYFKHQRQLIEECKVKEDLIQNEKIKRDNDIPQNEMIDPNKILDQNEEIHPERIDHPVEKADTKISLKELKTLTNESKCTFNLSHINFQLIPPIDEKVTLDDIIKVYEGIDWKKHEHVIVHHLNKDKRWREVGCFNSTPLDYFDRNLRSLILSIKNKNILQGKPLDYEMLTKYFRFIAQELSHSNDELLKADCLIILGIEAGEYCGDGKFKVIEEMFGNLCSRAEGLPIEFRVLVALQQERMRIWQQIYELVWKTNPIWQLDSYATDSLAVHNINIFLNLTRAGQKFGIPDQSAANDQTAAINPITHYLAVAFVKMIENSFWKGSRFPQCYFDVEKPRNLLKFWDYIHFKRGYVSPDYYSPEGAVEKLESVIGTVQIEKSVFYSWWNTWIEGQSDLTDKDKTALSDEFLMQATLNGEPLEVNRKIQKKFIIAMLIEMGIFNKPNLLLNNGQIQNPAELVEKGVVL